MNSMYKKWCCLLACLLGLEVGLAQDFKGAGPSEVEIQVRQDEAEKVARQELKSDSFRGGVRKWVQLGHAAYSQEQYVIAYDRYLRGYEKEKDSANRKKLEFLLGKCQTKLNHPKSAYMYYTLIWEAGGRDADFLRLYADALLAVGHYSQAEQVLAQLESQGLAGEWTEVKTQSVLHASAGSDMQESFGISAMDIVYDTNLNTSFSEYGPSLALGQLFFSSSRPYRNQVIGDPRTGQGYSRLYSASYQNGRWTNPLPLSGDLANLDGNVGTFSYDSIRNLAYFTWSNGTTNSIYTVMRQADGSWGQMTQFLFNYKSGGDDFLGKVAHPCVSKDGERLLFVYKDPAGTTGTDIWYVERVDQPVSTSKKKKRTTRSSRRKKDQIGQAMTVNPEWGMPVRLGDEVNSPGRESFPYWVNDSAFIFSSNGHVGLGGMDLYLAQLDGQDNTRIKEVNAFPMPINSSYDDNALIVDAAHHNMIISSDRFTDWGRTDNLFRLDKWGARYQLHGAVVASDSAAGFWTPENPMMASHAGEMVDNAVMQVMPEGEDTVLCEFRPGSGGVYQLPYLAEGNYHLRIEADGYDDFSMDLVLEGDYGGLPLAVRRPMTFLLQKEGWMPGFVQPEPEPEPEPVQEDLLAMENTPEPLVDPFAGATLVGTQDGGSEEDDLSPREIIDQLDHTKRYIPTLNERVVTDYQKHINDPMRRARLSVVPDGVECEVCGKDEQMKRSLDKPFFVKSGDDKAVISLTNQYGQVSYVDLAPNSAYEIEVQSVGHDNQPRLPSGITKDDVVTKVVTRDYVLFECMPKLAEINDEVLINNVYFDFGKAELIKDGPRELDRLIIVAIKNPDMYFQIEANADERGSEQFNQKLTDKRLAAVTSYVERKGMDMSRVIGKSFGESNPLIKNAVTENEHRLNRRTTFRLLRRDAVNVLAADTTYPVVQVDHLATSDLRFMVQVGAFRTPLENPLDYYSDILTRNPGFELTYYMDADGLYKYNVGGFYPTLDAARAVVKTLLEQKRECYVAAFYRDKRITIAEAEAIMKSQGRR